MRARPSASHYIAWLPRDSVCTSCHAGYFIPPSKYRITRNNRVSLLAIIRNKISPVSAWQCLTCCNDFWNLPWLWHDVLFLPQCSLLTILGRFSNCWNRTPSDKSYFLRYRGHGTQTSGGKTAPHIADTQYSERWGWYKPLAAPGPHTVRNSRAEL